MTAITGDVLVVEPGDALVILCGAPADHREQLARQLRAAMPGVRVEVPFLWQGRATLLYRPNRDRARTDADPAPPSCTPDRTRVTGWRCDPRRGVHVHDNVFATRLAWQADVATGVFTSVCNGCLHPANAAGFPACVCDCHVVWREHAGSNLSPLEIDLLRTVMQHRTPPRGGATIETQSFAPPVHVPERVDELPPLGDVGHDQAADQ